MGNFQSMLDDELHQRYMGRRGVSKWVAFYGKPSIDRKLNIMLDQIESIVSDLPMEQIMIHRRKCESCKASLPKFRMISNALSDRLPNYKSKILELKECLEIDGERTNITGMHIFQKYKDRAKGVPFFIQNAKVSSRKQDFYLEPANDYFVVYVGKLDPFRFLATAFNIENEWIESAL